MDNFRGKVDNRLQEWEKVIYRVRDRHGMKDLTDEAEGLDIGAEVSSEAVEIREAKPNTDRGSWQGSLKPG